MEQSEGLIGNLAASIGASRDALTLLISLLLGYPLALIYRQWLYGTSPWKQHLYFTLTGLWLTYFNFGINIIHPVANILLNYLLLVFLGGSSMSVVLAFVINMGYLCIGYYVTMTDSYTIRWTTAHCVLTLRLTGVVFDVFDGKQKQEKLSAEQQETALSRKPSLLEMMAHSFYFGGTLVGPQFSMKRYQDLVGGAFSDPKTGACPDSIKAGFLRLAAGIFYVALYQLSGLIASETDFTAPWYEAKPFWWKILHIAIWGKFVLNRYVACWLITEGACIITGLTYNGLDSKGKPKFDACANIDITGYESSKNGQEVIAAFNINTNKWAAKYVFKRLKFLGNKTLSQGATLLFLALWHGLVSGYFVCFYLELVNILTEKDVISIFQRTGVDAWFRPFPRNVLKWCLCKFYQLFSLGYALVGFCTYSINKWGPVYYQTYFVIPIIYTFWPLVSPFIKKLVLPKVEINGNQSKKQE